MMKHDKKELGVLQPLRSLLSVAYTKKSWACSAGVDEVSAGVDEVSAGVDEVKRWLWRMLAHYKAL